jgi:hypothetical protein
MKDVYANCYVMIAADDSPNPHGGCIASIKDESRSSHAVESVGPHLSKVRAFVRLTHMRDTFHMEVCHRIGQPQTTSELSRSVLNQRGWCLQERVLAPRIIHFSQSEFAWQCPETIACECQCTPTSIDKESRFKALLGDRMLRGAQFQEEGSVTRELTYHTDILHAISGLAGFMAVAAKAEYVCGIWKKELPEFLMWTVDHGDTLPDNLLTMARPFRLQSSTHTPSSPVRPRRHESYHAPSWSWASVVGPIKFQVGRLDTSANDQIAHVRKDGKTERVKTQRKSLLEAVDIECATEPLHPFGPPRHASLTVRGQTLPVTWIDKEKSKNSTSDAKEGGTLIYIPASAASDTTPFAVDFLPDLQDADLDVSIGHSLLLLYVLVDLEATIANEEMLPGSVVGVKGKMLMGLVLALGAIGGDNRVRSSAQPVYRRVGIFEAAGDENWQEVANKKTVVIV